MVQRRERGEGSLTYDRNANRWVGRLDLGPDQNGRRQRLKVTGRTRTEARSRLDALHADHQAGLEVTDRAVTFDQLATLWLTRGLPTDTAETTRQNYEAIVRVHLLPSLGPKRVGDLRPNDLEQLLDAMATAGYSGRTLRLTLTLARRILRLGQRRDLLARNVAEVVQAPRGPVRERHGLTPDQARALLAAAQQDRLGGLITVSLLLGLRPGEAAGLTWDAVDLDADPPTLRVERSLRRSSSGMILSPPKTPTSRRVVALPQVCVDALARQRQTQDADRSTAGRRWHNPNDLVFTTDIGTPLDPSNVRRRLHHVADRAGLDHLHPHLLRHAAASLLSAAGVPLEQISDLLGHRSITVTAEVYRHPLSPVRSGHLDAIAELTKTPTANEPTG